MKSWAWAWASAHAHIQSNIHYIANSNGWCVFLYTPEWQQKMERALAKVKHHSKEVSCLRTWQKKRPSKCECQCECDITNISKNKRARIHTRAVRLQAKFIHVRKCAILSLSLFSAHTFACTHFQKSIFYLKNFLNHKSDLAIYSTFALYYANVFLFVDFDIFRVHEHFGLILLLLLARLFFFLSSSMNAILVKLLPTLMSAEMCDVSLEHHISISATMSTG